MHRLATRFPDPPRRFALCPLARVCALLCLAGATAVHADEGLKLAPTESLIDPHTYPRETTPSYGIADSISGTVNDEVLLAGHAQLRRARTSIKAQSIHYFQVEDEVLATGSVRLYDSGSVYTGPELRMRLDDGHGYFVTPTFAFGSNGSRGFADRLDFEDRDHYDLYQGVYTTCPPGDYEWYLTADSMRLDQEQKEGLSRNVVLYFQGVPILASPYLSFPLSDQRKSGFLPPMMSLASRNGFELVLPYYWNIAPNRDLTIYPNLMTDRGLQIGENFRFLEPEQYGYVRAEGLEDDETKTFRYSESVLDYWHGSGWLSGFSAVVNYNRVSDSEYFNDFSRNFAASSTRTLPRDIEGTYATADWYVTTRFLSYQTLEQPTSYITPPYAKLPEVVFHGAKLDLGGFDFIMDADATRFESAGQVGGDRVVLNPALSYPIVAPGYFFTPRIAFNSTFYNLTDVSAAQPNSLDRNLPVVSVDGGLEFERHTDLFGGDYLQTLEPRLFYVYRPYQDQSNFPNFDSALPDFNFQQIFADNTFLGYDRLADENQLTTAVTTRLLDENTGAEVIRAAFGERFYFTEQRVTLPGGSPVPSGNSDLLGLVQGKVARDLSVDFGVDYNPNVNGLERGNIGASWSPGQNKVVSVEYRYLRGTISQFDVSGEWPLGGGIYGVGRINYSPVDHTVVEGLLGIEWRGCCWAIRAAAQRYVTGLNQYNTAIFVELELNGFSTIGTNPLDALRRNVLGYQPIVAPAPPVSPFANYE